MKGNITLVRRKKMANKKFWLVMLVMVLALGLTAVGCTNTSTGGEADTAINGIWVNLDGDEIIFNNGRFEMSYDGYPKAKGTYTINESDITFLLRQYTGIIFAYGAIWDLGLKWYKRPDMKAAFDTSSAWNKYLTEAQINELIESLFSPKEVKYSVSGNKLTMAMYEDEDPETFTRQKKFLCNRRQRRGDNWR
jgi:hypothetical protein